MKLKCPNGCEDKEFRRHDTYEIVVELDENGEEIPGGKHCIDDMDRVERGTMFFCLRCGEAAEVEE